MPDNENKLPPKYKAIATVNDTPETQAEILAAKVKELDDMQDSLAEGKQLNKHKKDKIKIIPAHTSASLISKVAKTISYELSVAKKKIKGLTADQEADIILNQTHTKFAKTELSLNKNLSVFGKRITIIVPSTIKGKRLLKTYEAQLIAADKIDANGELISGYALWQEDYAYDDIKFNIYIKLDGDEGTIKFFANTKDSKSYQMTEASYSVEKLGVVENDIVDITSYCPENHTPWKVWFNDESAQPDLYNQIGLIQTLDTLWDDVLPNWLRIRDMYRAHEIYGGKAKALEEMLTDKLGVSSTKTVQNKYVSDVSIITGTDKTNSLLMKIKEINQQILADALIDTVNIKSNNKHNEGEHREMRPAKLKILALKVIREMDLTDYYSTLIACAKKLKLIKGKVDVTAITVELDIPLNLYETEQLEANPKAQVSIRENVEA